MSKNKSAKATKPSPAQLRWLVSIAAAGGSATKPAGNRAAARAASAWVRNAEACAKLRLAECGHGCDWARLTVEGWVVVKQHQLEVSTPAREEAAEAPKASGDAETAIKAGGLHAGRLADSARNFGEVVYARAWKNQRTLSVGGPGQHHLDYLLHEGQRQSTAREHQVAATVIQWLGTEVGQDFVRQCQKKIEAGLQKVRRARKGE